MEKEPFEKESQGVKQVIVVRKDLNMRKGKIAAQVAHASLGLILGLMKTDKIVMSSGKNHVWYLSEKIGGPIELWLNGPFAKICVYVNSDQELLDIQHKATELSVPNYLITDSGKTEFGGVPTRTCIAVGPDFNSKVDLITGGLPLL